MGPALYACAVLPLRTLIRMPQGGEPVRGSDVLFALGTDLTFTAFRSMSELSVAGTTTLGGQPLATLTS